MPYFSAMSAFLLFFTSRAWDMKLPSSNPSYLSLWEVWGGHRGGRAAGPSEGRLPRACQVDKVAPDRAPVCMGVLVCVCTPMDTHADTGGQNPQENDALAWKRSSLSFSLRIQETRWGGGGEEGKSEPSVRSLSCMGRVWHRAKAPGRCADYVAAGPGPGEECGPRDQAGEAMGSAVLRGQRCRLQLPQPAHHLSCVCCGSEVGVRWG